MYILMNFVERLKHFGILSFQITFGVVILIISIYVITLSFFSSDEQFEGAIYQTDELYKEADIHYSP